MTDGSPDAILVLVADEQRRRFIADILSDDGLMVMPVSGPTQALEAVRSYTDGFALMLLETAAVPGLAFAQIVRRTAPRLRLLFVVSDENAARAWLWEYGTVLSAPFTAAELQSVARASLARAGGD